MGGSKGEWRTCPAVLEDGTVCGKSYYIQRSRAERGLGIACCKSHAMLVRHAAGESEKTRRGETRTCVVCGKEFYATRREVDRDRRTCSGRCAQTVRWQESGSTRAVTEKRCSACGIVKPASDYYSPDKHGYLPARCKECMREADRKRRKREPSEPTSFPTEPMKCIDCGQVKPVDEFPWSDQERGFRRRRCRSCYAEFVKPIRERHSAKHREAINAASRQYHHEHREERNRDRRRRAVMRKFSLTEEEYDKWTAAGACAICGTVENQMNGTTYRLAVDHDHETGAVRGLLCHRCNWMLGYARDDVAVLAVGISYLALAEQDSEKIREAIKYLEEALARL